MRAGVETLAPVVGVAAACHALGVPRSTYYRSRSRTAAVPAQAAAPLELLPDPMPEVLVLADPPSDLTTNQLADPSPVLLAEAPPKEPAPLACDRAPHAP